MFVFTYKFMKMKMNRSMQWFITNRFKINKRWVTKTRIKNNQVICDEPLTSSVTDILTIKYYERLRLNWWLLGWFNLIHWRIYMLYPTVKKLIKTKVIPPSCEKCRQQVQQMHLFSQTPRKSAPECQHHYLQLQGYLQHLRST